MGLGVGVGVGVGVGLGLGGRLGFRTSPCRWPPAQTPRVSSSGGSPCAATGSANTRSHWLTHRFEKAAAGPG